MKFLLLFVLISCASDKEFTRNQREFLQTLHPAGRAFIESCYQTNTFHECMGKQAMGRMFWQKMNECNRCPEKAE